MAGYRFLKSSVRPVARSSAAGIRAYSQKVKGNKNGRNRTGLAKYINPAGVCAGIGLTVCYVKLFRDKIWGGAADRAKELQQ